MRNFVLAVTIALIVLPFQLVWAQLIETRPLPAFKAVKNMGSMKVILQKGNQESATIQSEKVELTDIATEVSEGELQIHFKPKVKVVWNNDNNYRGNVVVIVTFKELQAVRNSGSGKTICEDVLRAENLEIKQSGSGSITLQQIDIAQNTHIKVSGSGKLEITTARIGGIATTEISGSGRVEIMGGTTQKLEAKVSGSGGLNLAGLEAENAEAKVSGSGKLRLAVVNHLEAKISGSGNILYKTKPRSVSADVTGSGRVKAME